jgi:2,5-diamino-6-(ribosylamino)-4(3H)-pyrimidinone 5'-phosphate reductase
MSVAAGRDGGSGDIKCRREEWTRVEEVSGAGAPDRPRVVVSVRTSVDGRVTLRRDQLLMDEDASRVWRSLLTPRAQALDDARSSQLASLYQPQAVLEGSGSLVTDSTGPLTGLLTEFGEPADVLYTDFLPVEVVERPDHEKWFTVVDSRGRVKWHTKRRGGFDLLVLVARATPPEYLAYLREECILTSSSISQSPSAGRRSD